MKRSFLFSLIFVSLFPALSFAELKLKNKVDLEDVKIKGESNKNNINFSNRSRHTLDDRIKLRTDFNKEILENLPTEFSAKKGF